MDEKLLLAFSKLVKKINLLLRQDYGSFSIEVRNDPRNVGTDLMISSQNPLKKRYRTIAMHFEDPGEAKEVMLMIKQHKFKIFW